LLGNVSVLVLLWYGGRLVAAASLSIGELVAFFSLIWYIINPIQQLGYQINNFTQSVAAGERLLEILDTDQSIKEAPQPIRLPAMRGHVRFERVSFAYPGGPPSLVDIDLDAPPGSVIGLLGPTGSGKTTLVSLIPRYYDVTAGRVTIDGHDVRSLSLSDLRRQVAIVFQETFLFSTTIRENIGFGRRDASFDEIVAAAKLAQAHDFIVELPDGYDTVVGERGLGLSGGQKQRIAIARALLADPRILILDDATASVDMETEHSIQTALSALMRSRTTFIIAHRIASVRAADEILVLDGGRIVERGRHEALLARGGVYRRIYDVQFRDYDPEALDEPAHRSFTPGTAARKGE
ncbi:MAG TPA: ABC transporter ATP-binding protein, partial [Limnochordia bacterium]